MVRPKESDEAQLIRDVLLAFGLLLSPASQMRPAGSAVGPGEACFAVWLALAIIRNFGRTDLSLTLAPYRIVIFWLLFAAALSIGTLTAFVLGMHNDPSLFMHDIKAYILVAGISLFCVLEPMAAARLKRVAWLVATLGSALLALQLAQAWGVLYLPRFDPWYWDRLRGWSENPNQLALVCIVIGFVSLHLAETATRHSERIVALACTILPFFVGLLTRSDSFLLVLAIACPVLALLKIRKWIQLNETRPGVRQAFAWMGVLCAPLLLILAAPIAYVTAGSSESLERQLSQNNSDAIERDAPERFELWMQAVDVGMASGMLGLGPGPHLIRVKPASVTPGDVPADDKHPSEDPTPNFESHNTILDLFTQGGLIAVISFGWLGVSTLLMTVRAKRDSLAVLLCGLAVFSAFHLIVRHPLLWFVIALCLVAAASNRRPSQTLEWS